MPACIEKSRNVKRAIWVFVCVWFSSLGVAIASRCHEPGVVRFYDDFESAQVQTYRSFDQRASVWLGRGESRCELFDGTTISISEPIVFFQQGSDWQRSVAIAADPAGTSNRVLSFEVDQAHIEEQKGSRKKARVQVSAYGNRGLHEVRVKARMYLGEGFGRLVKSGEPVRWLTIAEFWADPVWKGGTHPFRISVNLVRPRLANDKGFKLGVRGQRYNQITKTWIETLWEVETAEFVIPVEEWITIEYSLRSSPDQHGRFLLSLASNGAELRPVVNLRVPTRDPRDVSGRYIDDFNPIKLYTSDRIVGIARRFGESLKIYWDELDIVGCAWPGRSICESF